MNQQDFDDLLETQLARVSSVLGLKTKEYATETDQLKNIRDAAELQGLTMQEAVGGMMAKHTVSIYSMLKDTGTLYPDAVWDEKITDHIIWLILLRAVLEDNYNQRGS